MSHSTSASTLAIEEPRPSNKPNLPRKRGRSVAHLLSPGAKAKLGAELHLGRVTVEPLTVTQAAGIVGAPIASVYAALAKIRRKEQAIGKPPNGTASNGDAKAEHLRDQLRRLVERYGGTDPLLNDLGVIEVEMKAREVDVLPTLLDRFPA